jgi:hypothetical protein
VALLTISAALAVELHKPCEQHPDIARIQRPVPVDPSVIVERRK